MAVSYYRLCFDPKDRSRHFKSADDFKAWTTEHLGAFEPKHAGYMILPWHHAVNSIGLTLWNVLVPGQESYVDGEESILTFLASKGWEIDGFTVIVYIKPAPGQNEVLFPIHEKAA